MKSPFFLSFFLIFIIFSQNCRAQTSGYGCNVDGGGVFTTYLGDAPYYGNNSDNRPVYLNSTAPGNFIIRNVMGYKSDGNHYNYVCGQLNDFNSDYGPSQRELTLKVPEVNCEVAASRNSPSGSASHGKIYNFTYNNPQYCGRITNNMPLDDYMPVSIVVMGIASAFVIRTKLASAPSLI